MSEAITSAAAPSPAERERWAWLIGKRESSRSERALAVVTAAVVALGLFLRIRGYLFHATGFWLDEAGWAMLTVEERLVELLIRPIGFIVLSRFFAWVFAPTEIVLRAMPWIAGMLTTVLAVPLARRLFSTPAARLLFVFIICLHPCAIDFSKEFKPYSISLCLHLTLVLLSLRYIQSLRTIDLWQLLLTAALGGLFAQDLIFAYPGVFLLVGWTALRENRRHLRLIVGVAGLILLLLAAQYFLLWRNLRPTDTDTFGEKYNVFYGHGSTETHFRWALSRHLEMAEFPGFRRRFWDLSFVRPEAMRSFQAVDAYVWLALHVAGLAVIASRRGRQAVLLVLPLAVLWLFNLFTLWPVGAFRANLFVIGYMSAIACVALDASARRVAHFVDVLPALVLVFLPLALLDRGWSATKRALTYPSDFPEMLAELLRLKSDADGRHRASLLIDRRSCIPYEYYTKFHPRTKRLAKQIERQFKVRCIGDDSVLHPELTETAPNEPRAVWAVVHNDAEIRRWLSHRRPLGASLVMTQKENVGTHTIVAFSRRSK